MKPGTISISKHYPNRLVRSCKADIEGTITVNAAGTLTVQFAQNTSNGTPSIVKRGSTFIVQDMP